MKKSPAQAKNFWGPFFQKFDSFWKKNRKINSFLAVLTVFSVSTTEKSPLVTTYAPPSSRFFGGRYFTQTVTLKKFSVVQKQYLFQKTQQFLYNSFRAF